MTNEKWLEKHSSLKRILDNSSLSQRVQLYSGRFHATRVRITPNWRQWEGLGPYQIIMSKLAEAKKGDPGSGSGPWTFRESFKGISWLSLWQQQHRWNGSTIYPVRCSFPIDQGSSSSSDAPTPMKCSRRKNHLLLSGDDLKSI